MQNSRQTATGLCALPNREQAWLPQKSANRGRARGCILSCGNFWMLICSELREKHFWLYLKKLTCRNYVLVFFCSSAPEKSILMKMLAEMYKGWQVFSRGMFWLKLKYLYYLMSFLGNKGAGNDNLLESRVTWKQLHVFWAHKTQCRE